MDEEELAEFITHDTLSWRIWMNGYEIGLFQGHQDERAGMEDLADLVARRQLVLEHCQEQIRAERANTLTMAEVRQAMDRTRIGKYTGGPVPWDKDGHE
ncbi:MULTISPECIES: hypothetical protein [Mycobacteriales]|uniref:hypothetical protein n=1 Tax=Mycobacteriales TaxID=85007 RepID=UPI0019D13789|nr:hypothetical protein [Rhodococcus sp. KRD162]